MNVFLFFRLRFNKFVGRSNHQTDDVFLFVVLLNPSDLDGPGQLVAIFIIEKVSCFEHGRGHGLATKTHGTEIDELQFQSLLSWNQLIEGLYDIVTRDTCFCSAIVHSDLVLVGGGTQGKHYINYTPCFFQLKQLCEKVYNFHSAFRHIIR